MIMPIDVLAVFRGDRMLIVTALGNSDCTNQELNERLDAYEEATDAVAELLEACRPAATGDGWDDAQYERFLKAFANAGGAA